MRIPAHFTLWKQYTTHLSVSRDYPISHCYNFSEHNLSTTKEFVVTAKVSTNNQHMDGQGYEMPVIITSFIQGDKYAKLRHSPKTLQNCTPPTAMDYTIIESLMSGRGHCRCMSRVLQQFQKSEQLNQNKCNCQLLVKVRGSE
jgi:hypothetical protein